MTEDTPKSDPIEWLRNEVNEMSKKVDVLEQGIETQKAELQGDIRELRTGTQKDIGFLNRLVWALVGGVVSLFVGIVLRVIGLI